MPEGRWRQIEIEGKRADVFEPSRAAESARAILFLHGEDLKSLKDSAVFTAGLDRFGFKAICPFGGRCWWCDVVCSQFDRTITPLAYLREHVVTELERQWGLRPPSIGVMGIGMGGQGALQLAYRHPKEFQVVTAISPAIDFHNWYGRGLELDDMFPSQEAARQATATLAFHPLNWPRHQFIVSDPNDPVWFEGGERLVSKLSSMGIPFECDLTTSRGGYGWDYFDAMAEPVLRFQSDRLDQVGKTV